MFPPKRKGGDIDALASVGAIVWSQARFRSAEIIKGKGVNDEMLDVVEDEEIVAKACLAVGEACRIGKFGYNASVMKDEEDGDEMPNV